MNDDRLRLDHGNVIHPERAATIGGKPEKQPRPVIPFQAGPFQGELLPFRARLERRAQVHFVGFGALPKPQADRAHGSLRAGPEGHLVALALLDRQRVVELNGAALIGRAGDLLRGLAGVGRTGREQRRVPAPTVVDPALGGGWPIDQAVSPSYMYVDYVRAYAKRR